MAPARKTPPKAAKSPADVQALVDLARAQGLRTLEVDGVKFEFAEKPLPPPATFVDRVTRTARKRGRPVPDAMGFLFWSTDEAISFLDGTTDAPVPPDAGKAPDLKH